MASKKGGMREDNDQRGGARAAAKRGDGNQDCAGAGNNRGEFVGGRAVTETEWRTYLRREIERLLEVAGERELRLTLKFLRSAA